MMSIWIVVLAAIFAHSNAGYIDSGYQESYDPHPHYSFQYSVHDPHTGDVKNQQESRDGDQVKGSYSLIEPDGSTRIVTYTADSHNGFNAVVHKEGGYHSSGNDHQAYEQYH